MVDPTTGTVVLVRARQGMGGQARRIVHLVPLPSGAEVSGVVAALCGTSLVADEVETVAPGAGVPCSRCVLCQDRGVLPPLPLATTYQVWGWPVTVCGDQVLLTLGVEATALVLPAGLAAAARHPCWWIRAHPMIGCCWPGSPTGSRYRGRPGWAS